MQAQDATINLHTLLTVLALIASSGGIGWIYRQGVRLEVLERMFEDKKGTINQVKETQDNHDRRLAVVESAVVELKEVLPELRNIGSLCAKMDSFISSTDRRLELLEDKVLLNNE